MLTRSVHRDTARTPRCWTARHWTRALLASSLVLAAAAPLRAQDAALPAVTLGAGVRTAFVHDMPDGADSTDNFVLDSARLYINGSVTSKIKVTFNTEYTSANNVQIMDAVGMFAFSDKFNIWVGRFLPPSDRSNLYGPYYAHSWAVYTDGVQDGYPTIAVGRDNGAMYWGQFGKVKVSAGAFDVTTAIDDNNLIAAGRVQVDFWDPEGGYYLNSTYYGDKNLLAIGAAGQVQGEDKNAYSVDFLLERKVGGAGAFTVESEWAKYDNLGGYNGKYGVDKGFYVLASYLFPKPAGIGKFEILGKAGRAKFREGIARANVDYEQKTSELNLNYVIKQFNARVMMFYLDKRYNAVQVDDKQFGVGLQLQM